jgi:hypothetical protein
MRRDDGVRLGQKIGGLAAKPRGLLRRESTRLSLTLERACARAEVVDLCLTVRGQRFERLDARVELALLGPVGIPLDPGGAQFVGGERRAVRAQ